MLQLCEPRRRRDLRRSGNHRRYRQTPRSSRLIHNLDKQWFIRSESWKRDRLVPRNFHVELRDELTNRLDSRLSPFPGPDALGHRCFNSLPHARPLGLHDLQRGGYVDDDLAFAVRYYGPKE